MSRKGHFLGFTFTLSTLLLLWIGMDLFNNPTILKATLEDDLSRMDLILKKNNRFESIIISHKGKVFREITKDKTSGSYYSITQIIWLLVVSENTNNEYQYKYIWESRLEH
jgi:hypothetical protein